MLSSALLVPLIACIAYLLSALIISMVMWLFEFEPLEATIFTVAVWALNFGVNILFAMMLNAAG